MSKLSEDTLEILENFTKFNKSVRLTWENGLLSTTSVAENMLVTAKTRDYFKHDWNIYDLNQLLSIIKMFNINEVDISCDERRIILKEGKTKAIFNMTPANMIKFPKKQFIDIQNENEFFLSKEHILSLEKAAGMLGSTHLKFLFNEKSVVISCFDKKNSSSNEFSLSIDSNVVNTNQRTVLIHIENFRLMKRDYTVYNQDFFLHFKNEEEINYWIAGEET